MHHCGAFDTRRALAYLHCCIRDDMRESGNKTRAARKTAATITATTRQPGLPSANVADMGKRDARPTCLPGQIACGETGSANSGREWPCITKARFLV
jgi:hypothetical protein